MRKQEEANRVSVMKLMAGRILKTDVRKEIRRIHPLTGPEQMLLRFPAFAAIANEHVFPRGVRKAPLHHVANQEWIRPVRIGDELTTDDHKRQHPGVLKLCSLAAILLDQRHSQSLRAACER